MTLEQRSNKVGLDFLPRFFTEDLLGRIKNFFDKVAVLLQRHTAGTLESGTHTPWLPGFQASIQCQCCHAYSTRIVLWTKVTFLIRSANP